MTFSPYDAYFRKAKREGFLARSVYKLQAIDAKYHLFRPGQRIVDLGAAPGSWSQYILQRCAGRVEILAVDRMPLRVEAPGLRFLEADIFSPIVEEAVQEQSWDGVVSDAAPATTGASPTDQARSAALVERSLDLAAKGLRPGGFWVAKLLEGPARKDLEKAAKALFQEVHTFRPPATRKGSTECFLIGLRRRL
ncbi:MAG: RlmE family RNA methyltransferase [Bacteroidia bacterium]|nr:RlmE family RNA methyltransferase [Bacteroidia bacterium]MDW8089036.1 RlmE family RNA methyltransferase [Bacteroidia bacterium]